MNPRPPILRRIALALMTHAAAVLPPERSVWAQGMSHELQHIESDLEAFTWATGCVLASYVERSRVATLLDTWYARAFLALLIARQVISMLFATVLTVAYRQHYLGVAAFMGGFTPGDDYRRFIPLMDPPNWWLHGLWVTAAVLYFASGWLLQRKRQSAFPLFAAAWVLGTVANLISRSSAAYQQVFSFPTPMFTRDYLVPAASALLPVFIAAALWAHNRCALASQSRRS